MNSAPSAPAGPPALARTGALITVGANREAAGPERSLAMPTPDSGFAVDAAITLGGIGAAADLPTGAVAPREANPDAPRAEKGSMDAVEGGDVDVGEGVAVSADLVGAAVVMLVTPVSDVTAIVAMGLIGATWEARESSDSPPNGSVPTGGMGAADRARSAPSKPDHSPIAADAVVNTCQSSPPDCTGLMLGDSNTPSRSSPRRLALVVAGSGALRHDEMTGRCLART